VPELPDITIYIEALEQRIAGQTLEHVQIASPFLLRTAAPPINSVEAGRWLSCAAWANGICVGFGRRFVARAASHDCRPPALATGETRHQGGLLNIHQQV